MKHLMLLLLLIGISFSLSAQSYPLIRAKNAKKYIGKEVTVEGRLSGFGNTSYAQFAWFYIGSDTSQKQLKVLIQGKIYYDYLTQTPLKKYSEQKVLIKGMVIGDKKDVYLNATDTIKLKK